jgi:hypothetical protein
MAEQANLQKDTAKEQFYIEFPEGFGQDTS